MGSDSQKKCEQRIESLGKNLKELTVEQIALKKQSLSRN